MRASVCPKIVRHATQVSKAQARDGRHRIYCSEKERERAAAAAESKQVQLTTHAGACRGYCIFTTMGRTRSSTSCSCVTSSENKRKQSGDGQGERTLASSLLAEAWLLCRDEATEVAEAVNFFTEAGVSTCKR